MCFIMGAIIGVNLGVVMMCMFIANKRDMLDVIRV